jgi:hypothetical protein
MLIALWGENTYNLENILLILSCHGEKTYIKMVKQFENAGLIMTYKQLWHKVYICSKIKHRIQCKTKYHLIITFVYKSLPSFVTRYIIKIATSIIIMFVLAVKESRDFFGETGNAHTKHCVEHPRNDKWVRLDIFHLVQHQAMECYVQLQLPIR